MHCGRLSLIKKQRCLLVHHLNLPSSTARIETKQESQALSADDHVSVVMSVIESGKSKFPFQRAITVIFFGRSTNVSPKGCSLVLVKANKQYQ